MLVDIHLIANRTLIARKINDLKYESYSNPLLIYRPYIISTNPVVIPGIVADY